MLFSPTVVFCPHREIAEAFHTIEYGLESCPPWVRSSGWVGPVPDNFLLNEKYPQLGERGNRVVPEIESTEAAGKFYFSIMRKLESDMDMLKHELKTGTFRVMILLEGNETGLALEDSEVKLFKQSVINFCRGNFPDSLKFEVLFVLLQDKALPKRTIDIIEEINLILTDDSGETPARCYAYDDDPTPPKVLLATTWDQNNIPTTMEELRYLGASVAHLGFIENNWTDSLLKASGWIDGKLSPAIIGLKGFFWERIRAVDLSRKKYFKECFVQKWLEEGWVPAGTYQKLPDVSYGGELETDRGEQPEKWGSLRGEWNREIWRALKTIKIEEGQATSELQSAKTIEEYRDALQRQVFGKINSELTREMEEARDKGKPKGRAVRRILNVITLLTKSEISDKFKLLNDACEKVKDGFSADFDSYHKERISSGTGLALLRRQYREIAREMELESAAYAQDKRTDFKTTDIMRFALGAIIAQLERPHGRTLKTSWAVMFAFFGVIFFNLFEMLNLSNTFISPIIGITVPLALFYLMANSGYDGRLSRIFSGIGWAFLLVFPLLGYGVYYGLTHYPIGNFIVHISAGLAVSFCLSLGIVAYQLRTTLHDFQRRKSRFNKEIKIMVEAIVNHKMVSSIREVMNHARTTLESRAADIDNKIEVANHQLEVYYNAPLSNPEAPSDMDHISMLNPAGAPQTK